MLDVVVFVGSVLPIVWFADCVRRLGPCGPAELGDAETLAARTGETAAVENV